MTVFRFLLRSSGTETEKIINQISADLIKLQQLLAQLSLLLSSFFYLQRNSLNCVKAVFMESHTTEAILKALIESEKLADEIIGDRQKIVDIDRIRNKNREALRYILRA